jgi:hypothetical protein
LSKTLSLGKFVGRDFREGDERQKGPAATSAAKVKVIAEWDA